MTAGRAAAERRDARPRLAQGAGDDRPGDARSRPHPGARRRRVGRRLWRRAGRAQRREQFSFRALAERANRYSRWALAAGLAKGDVVALMMGARPEYFALWLGLTQVGVVVALFNVNLAGAALAHCVRVAGARGGDRRGAVRRDSAPTPSPACRSKSGRHGGGDEARRVDLALSAFSGAPLDDGERRATTLSDRALLIFTSGTTGLPKAAAVSHHRVVAWSHWFAGLADMRADDRMYDCLPLCHSVGGVAALAAALVNGGSVVIAEQVLGQPFLERRRALGLHDLSVHRRALPLSRRRAAVARRRRRIGCASPAATGFPPTSGAPSPSASAWPQILEFYASTEGNLTLYNVEGKVGAIGRQPPFLAARDAIALARFDYEREAPRRGPDGFCARCGVDEVGEALGRIGDEAGQRFEGYTEPAETEKKILRDVFAPGDAWMRTGDLMRRDREGFYYFVDRVGDTFRWKGENVATSEVAAALRPRARRARSGRLRRRRPQRRRQGGHGGADDRRRARSRRRSPRAASALPRYARPLFLRLPPALEATATFKPLKRALVAEGFDPARVADPLYVYDAEADAYVALDAERYAAIASGDTRL